MHREKSARAKKRASRARSKSTADTSRLDTAPLQDHIRKRIKELEGKSAEQSARGRQGDDTLERLKTRAGDTRRYLLSHDDGSHLDDGQGHSVDVRSASGARPISSPIGVTARSSAATTRPAPKREVPAEGCELLTVCDDWTKLDDLAARGLRLVVGVRGDDRSHGRADAAGALRSPIAIPAPAAMDTLQRWNPQAGFFHATTKDVRFRLADGLRARAARARAPAAPPRRPSSAIRIARDHRSSQRPDANGELATVLHARRTWRRYSAKPVTLDELATMLALSAGVQLWVTGADVPIPLKTSPSGGARHATECLCGRRRTSTA